MSEPVIARAIGDVDGSRTDFETPSVYVAGTLWAFLDGQLIHKDDDDGPIELGENRVRMKKAPRLTSRLVFWYHEQPVRNISYPTPPEFLVAFELVPFVAVSTNLEPLAYSAEDSTVIAEEIIPDDFYAVLDLSPRRRAALDLVPIPYTNEVLQPETEPAPELIDLRFLGGYPALPTGWGIPGNQTALKAGDTFQIFFMADQFCTGARVFDQDACVAQTFSFEPSYSGLLTVEIANRGETTRALPAWVQVCNVFGEYGEVRATNFEGGTTNGKDFVYLNNALPSGTLGLVTYPVGQGALKGSETALVAVTALNYESITFTSPPAELSISNSSVFEASKQAQRIGGSTRFSGSNLQMYLRRVSNGTEATVLGLVQIANVPIASATISLPYSRLRSGGNDGSSVPSYIVTVVLDQPAIGAPSLSPATNGGVWSGSWGGGLSSWTRALQVRDSDSHATHSWVGFSVTNLAGLVTTSFSPTTYVIGGSVRRVVGPFPAFEQEATVHVVFDTYSKIRFGYPSLNESQTIQRNPIQGNRDDILWAATVESMGTPETIVFLNDRLLAGQNTLGRLTISYIEELV
jgi:hypothetical protein